MSTGREGMAAVTKPAPAGDEQAPDESDLGVRVLLGFIVGQERYALPLESVREILRPLPVTEVPRAPKHVMGVFSVRGTITTLVDTHVRLNVPGEGLSQSARILLVDQGDELVGLLVDAVLQVYRLRQDEVELAPNLAGDAPAYIIGIGRPRPAQQGEDERATSHRLGGELLVLLDPVGLLRM